MNVPGILREEQHQEYSSVDAEIPLSQLDVSDNRVLLFPTLSFPSRVINNPVQRCSS